MISRDQVDDIRCRTRLTPKQIAATLAPPPRTFVFAFLMGVLWSQFVSLSTLATTLVVLLLASVAIKAMLFGLLMILFPWRVHFEQDRMEMYQGKRLDSQSQLSSNFPTAIAIIEDGLLPRILRLTKSDGTSLDTLYGVSRADMEKVIAQIQFRTGGQ